MSDKSDKMQKEKKKEGKKKKQLAPQPGDLVCVTGANGFIASWIVKMLVSRGYKVRGTVRSVKDTKKIEHLTALGDAVELVEADLNDPNAFFSVFKGCKWVLHTASPYVLTVKDPQKDLVDPAVNGTIAVMEAAVKCGVKKIVLTSSMAAITDNPIKKYTEADWNDKSSLTRNPYYYSKTLAERAAWDFVQNRDEAKNLKLVVINPYYVVGPFLQKADKPNGTHETFVGLLTGKFPGVLRMGWGMVDVRDVALSHVLALENPNADGRYICCNQTMWMRDIIEKIRARYPNATLPSTNLSHGFGSFLVKVYASLSSSGANDWLKTTIDTFAEYDNSKIQNDLGLKFRNMDSTIDDTVDFLIMSGFVPGLQPHKDAPQDWATTLTAAERGSGSESQSSSSK